VGDGEGTGIDREGIPPGTLAPTPSAAIFRSEPTVDGDGPDRGNGFANNIEYDRENDTFSVDNLAFDGDRPYERGTLVSSLSRDDAGVGRFQVYESPATVVDPRAVGPDNPTGEVRQFVYRAVYGVSRNRFGPEDARAATTQFAIVRTGSYVDYGFGGFIYQRDNTLVLPTEGLATFDGHSAGLRDFENQGGLQYTTADVRVTIDFSDFNDGTDVRGDGLEGRIYNRRVLDLEGNDITAEVAATLGEGVSEIPDALFIVGPDRLDNNGDLVTDIRSDLPNGAGVYESGTFYGIVAGEADEIVGVFVLESEAGDVNSRDTGGFIVYRGDTQ
jgi:hypothetical protein